MTTMIQDVAHDTAAGWDAAKGEYVLPPLPYDYAALEPYIDEQTMRLHHDIHHAGYVKGLNAALKGLEEMRAGVRPPSEVGDLTRRLSFHGSGHFLHVVFWNSMAPPGKGVGGEAQGRVGEAIDRDFGGMTPFRVQFKSAAAQVEGSGWAILALEPVSGRLMILQAEKHQNLSVWGVVPLLSLDVWEHAYYLRYQNRRADYIDAWLNLVNWDFPSQHLDRVLPR